MLLNTNDWTQFSSSPLSIYNSGVYTLSFLFGLDINISYSITKISIQPIDINYINSSSNNIVISSINTGYLKSSTNVNSLSWNSNGVNVSNLTISGFSVIGFLNKYAP